MAIKWTSPAPIESARPGKPRRGAAQPPAAEGKRRFWRRRNILITAALAVALVVCGETAARIWLGGALRGSAESMLGGRASVGIGLRPALIDSITGSVPTLTIHETQVGVCTIQGVTVDATLNDARRQNGHLAVSGSHASILLPTQLISAMVGKQVGGGGAVVPDPARDQLVLHIGGLLDVYEQPSLQGNAIAFKPVSVGVGGFGVPAGIANQVVPKASFQQKLPQLPLSMHPDGVQVTSAGVVITASGPAAQTQPNGRGPTTAKGLRTC